VGNAVPPPLGRTIASEFTKALGRKPTRPNRSLDLGDPRLLEMDMTEAAKYWGVDLPIGKRDRKSGAKKRKQEDIEAVQQKGVKGSLHG
jgi:DNA (cytosine-5)-methyltransferase 1